MAGLRSSIQIEPEASALTAPYSHRRECGDQQYGRARRCSRIELRKQAIRSAIAIEIASVELAGTEETLIHHLGYTIEDVLRRYAIPLRRRSIYRLLNWKPVRISGGFLVGAA